MVPRYSEMVLESQREMMFCFCAATPMHLKVAAAAGRRVATVLCGEPMPFNPLEKGRIKPGRRRSF